MRADRRSRVLLAGAAIAFAAQTALACPVCFDATDANVLRTYGYSVLFLSALPFCLIGGLALAAWFLRKPPAGIDVSQPDAPSGIR